MWSTIIKNVKKNKRFIDTLYSCGIPYVWVLLGQRVHQRHQVFMLVWHYDLVDVVQQDIAWALHGPINALVKGGLLTKVVHITTTFRVQPAMWRNHVTVDGPRNYLHKVLLNINPEQAVELWAAAIVVDHYSVHTEQSAENKRKRDNGYKNVAFYFLSLTCSVMVCFPQTYCWPEFWSTASSCGYLIDAALLAPPQPNILPYCTIKKLKRVQLLVQCK